MVFGSPELAAGGIFPQHPSGFGGSVFAIVLLALSLVLMFYGRSVIRGLSFFVVGLVGASFGILSGGLVLGFIGALAGGVVGFVLGGMLGMFFVDIGIGVALGYFGYLAVFDLTNAFILAVAVGFVLFVIGAVVSGKLLELGTAVVGGFILYGVLVFFGAGPLSSAAVSVLIAGAGFYFQDRKRRSGERWRQVPGRPL
jgi:hypothetical protein